MYRKHTLITNYFNKIDTEEKAYILGFFYADGYNNQNRGIIEFSQKECRLDILNNIKIAIGTSAPIIKYPGARAHSLTVCSKKMSADLAKAGATQNKAHKLVFPSVEILPEKLIPHFIRGYFDGDGCVWEGKRKEIFSHRYGKLCKRHIHNIKFTLTGAKRLISGIQEYLVNKIGFNRTKLNIRHSASPDIVTLEYSGANNLRKFYNLLYNDATIYCNLKYNKFNEIFCALDEKSSSETRLIAGTPEMVISSQAKIILEGSSTIPEMEVESSDSKCLAPNM